MAHAAPRERQRSRSGGWNSAVDVPQDAGAQRIALRLVVVSALSIVGSAMGCVCSKSTPSDDGGITVTASKTESSGFTTPLAATHVGNGAVIVAGLDVGAKALRVKKLGEHDEVLGERTLLDGLASSPESELKIVPAAGGAAITWRGMRHGKIVR